MLSSGKFWGHSDILHITNALWISQWLLDEDLRYYDTEVEVIASALTR
jgi:hypothetical protein